MTRISFLLYILTFFLLSCSKSFLTVPVQGPSTASDTLNNYKGVQALLVGAYHDLTGMDTKSTWWGTAGTNWLYGDITSGDTYVGGTAGNGLPHGVPDALLLQNFQALSSTGFLDDKWVADYDGVARANAVIRACGKAQDMTDAQKTEVIAEARFLRGHFHFDAKKMWNNVPYIDENVISFTTLSNETDIWPQIEEDFKFAYDNLLEQQPLPGQANKWAAACYLAKCYMFEKKYSDALTLLNTIIASGKNSNGVKYGLVDCYHDNFRVTTENNKESVLQIQFSVDQASIPINANVGETGVSPLFYQGSDVYYGYWKQPSFNLVNAFKTDAGGLPMMDASGNDTSNVTNMTNDMGISSYDPFTPYQGTVDPRLDWTVGRRGVPYLDWGIDPGQSWIYDQGFGGPYLNMKNMYFASEQDQGYNVYISYDYEGNSAVNYNIIRFADVLLWAAECEVEVGSLETARGYVNQIRQRAQNGCKPDIDNSSGSPSANYNVEQYTSTWTSKDFARNAVYFERRLEFAQEGHRFFDLVRWGIADTYLNAYLQKEQTRGVGCVQAGSTFVKGKHEYFPIPQQEIILDPKLKQNPGY
ncbi:MAG TPA: RagB/SusD family nutrient uptake outer membrane protein [Puia sp.]|nr:RagB/SusD family nutrient uptake outer membrane protein [Puia sp.]